MKLKEVLGGKTGGEFFRLDRDIEKKVLTIVERTGIDDEIREYDTGKTYKNDRTGKDVKQVYFCLKCNDGKETKDLHCTWYALKQIAAVLPPQFYGAQFVIDVIRAKGVLDVRYIQTVPISNLADFEKKQVAEDPMSLVLGALTPPGIHDSRIEDLTEKACKGNKSDATFLWNMLKTGGRVVQKPDGCWVRT